MLSYKFSARQRKVLSLNQSVILENVTIVTNNEEPSLLVLIKNTTDILPHPNTWRSCRHIKGKREIGIIHTKPPFTLKFIALIQTSVMNASGILFKLGMLLLYLVLKYFR